MTKSQANLQLITRFIAWGWGLAGIIGLCLVAFGLAISDPIEPEDWMLTGVFFVVFVAVPLAVVILAQRAKSWLAVGWLVAGGALWSVGLSWIISNG